MEAVGPIVAVILVIVAIAVAIYVNHLIEKKRRLALAALANELGWQFDPSHDHEHDDEYAHFEVFRHGHGRVAYNTLLGNFVVDQRTYPTKMGDFRYKVTRSTGKGSSTRTYNLSYIIVHLPFRRVPDLLIRREGVFDKLAGAIGFDDIDFESAEFSKRFYVKSPDKRFAYDVVHPRAMEFLMQTDPPAIDLEHGRLCIVDGTRRWKPAEFKSYLAWVDAFFDLWPDYLTEQLDA